MEISKSCQTCPIVHKCNQIIINLKNTFDSKKDERKLRDPVLEIDVAKEKEKLSFYDLKNQFGEDYPRWRKSLISVPTAFLLKYTNKVPFYVTENDVKKYLSDEFKRVSDNKRNMLSSANIKTKVIKILQKVENLNLSIEKASELLNEHILDIVFVGEKDKIVCKKCEHKLKCTNKKCPAKIGLRTKFDVAKNHYQKNLWPCAMNRSLVPEDIIKFAEKKLEENIKRFMSETSEFSLLSSMRGQKNENNLVSLLQSHLNNLQQPGLLINSYKVYSSLKNLLKRYGIKLSLSKSDETQVEHDNMTIIPLKDEVRISFIQAKATVQLPWPHSADKNKNTISSCQKAFQQALHDIVTFTELCQHFLSKKEYNRLVFNFTVYITSLQGISEEEICKNCRRFILEEEKLHTKEEEQVLLGVRDLCLPTPEAVDIFKTLATLYVGGGSIVEMKNSQEGYIKEVKRLKHVEEGMMKVFQNTDESVYKSCVAENKTIKLGPDQNNIYSSGIGLHQSYAVMAPWGGGKSMLLELELKRVVELYNETKEPVKIYIVVYEIKALDLVKHYQSLVCDFQKRGNVQIEVLNLKQICDKYDIEYKNR